MKRFLILSFGLINTLLLFSQQTKPFHQPTFNNQAADNGGVHIQSS